MNDKSTFVGYFLNMKREQIMPITTPGMCQDLFHLFLDSRSWPKLRKIRNNKGFLIHHWFLLPLIALISPFHVRFNSVFYQTNFERNVQDPADTAEPWIKDQSGFLFLFMGFKSFHHRNPLSHTHWPFSRRIMFSEAFRNIPKVSETLDIGRLII